MKKKVLSIALAVCMVLSLMPTISLTASAADDVYPIYVITMGESTATDYYYVYKETSEGVGFVPFIGTNTHSNDYYWSLYDASTDICSDVKASSATVYFGNTGSTDQNVTGTMDTSNGAGNFSGGGTYTIKGSLSATTTSALTADDTTSIIIDGATLSGVAIGNIGSGTITVNSGIIAGGTTNAIVNNGSGSLIINGGKISSESTAAIANSNNGKITISGDEWDESSETGTLVQGAWGVVQTSGTLQIDGGTIIGTGYAGTGGPGNCALWVNGSASLTYINGGTIKNTATNGYGIKLASAKNLHLSGTPSIFGPTADIYTGNPIYASNGTTAYTGDKLTIDYSATIVPGTTIAVSDVTEGVNDTKFTLVNDGYYLALSGTDLVINAGTALQDFNSLTLNTFYAVPSDIGDWHYTMYSIAGTEMCNDDFENGTEFFRIQKSASNSQALYCNSNSDGYVQISSNVGDFQLISFALQNADNPEYNTESIDSFKIIGYKDNSAVDGATQTVQAAYGNLVTVNLTGSGWYDIDQFRIYPMHGDDNVYSFYFYIDDLETGAPIIDTTSPTLSSYTPIDGAADVAVNTPLTLSFSEDVTAVSGKNITIIKASDNSTIQTIAANDSTQVSVSGNVVTITPSSSLYNSTQYYIFIDSGAFKDASGNTYAGISNTMAWSFTTVAAAAVTRSVTYNWNYTGAPEPYAMQTVTSGNNTTAPEIPARSGYTFGGWYTDAACTTAFEFTTIINSDTTLYAKWTAESSITYTVTYNGNGASSGSVPTDSTAYAFDATVTVKGNTGSLAKTGYIFFGWNTKANGIGTAVSAGGSFTVTGNTILYAQWTQNATYTVSGQVTGAAIYPATVTIKYGQQTVDTTTTDGSNNYSFSGLPAGTYNVVGTDGTNTKTEIVTVTNADISNANISISTNSSILDVKDDTPPVVVGGLDTEAASQSATITMTVQEKSSSSAEGFSEIGIAASGQTVDTYLDIKVTKTDAGGTSDVLTLNNVVEIIVPYDFSGKADVTLYRYHGTEASIMTKVNARITSVTTGDDGKYYLDTTNGYIYIYANKFSTYAIAYTQQKSYGGGNSSGSTSYAITASAGTGGSISPSSISVAGGGSKTFTITADEGYTISDVLVDGASVGAVSSYTFSNLSSAHTIRAVFGEVEGLPYYVDDKGNSIFIGFASDVGGTMKYIAPEGKTVLLKENSKNFSDISGHWGKAYIDFVTKREIFVGTGSNVFSPDAGMTRAMFATVIGRLYERSYGELTASTEHIFTDVEYDSYYGDYIDWAAENNIIVGVGGGIFEPESEITRQEMAAILYRFAEFLGVSGTSMEKTQLSYPDASVISSWAKEAALYCQQTGIITGRDGGSFVPKGTATRAEVAAILERFIETAV